MGTQSYDGQTPDI